LPTPAPLPEAALAPSPLPAPPEILVSPPVVADEPAKKKSKAAEDDDESAAPLQLTPRLRVITGFQLERDRPAGTQTESAEQEYGFIVRQVRLGLRGQLTKELRANVSFELTDFLSPETGGSYDSPELIRTATLDYRPSRAFRLRVGRFKRPFSELELTSAADLPILNRGLFNGLALENNQWGDRAVGMQASGRIKALDLRWYLSLFNPAWSSVLDYQGVDVIGRVQWSPIKALSLSGSAGYKNLEIGTERVHASAFGGDVTLQLGAAHVLVEGYYADLPLETGRPSGFAGLVLFDYLLGLDADWALQPTFFAELADADAEISQTESARLVFGVNLIGHEHFRIMPQLALVRSLGDTSQLNPWLESETYSLIFSLVL
jgi:hypothetical protein